MNGDESFSLHIVFQGSLDPVANFMSLGDTRITGDDKMEFDECHAPGMAHSNIMRLNGTSCMLTD